MARGLLLGVSLVAFAGCGGMPMPDAGVDAGNDSGVVVRTDAGTDAGTMTTDAGPPPPRVVFGSMTVDGTNVDLEAGYGTGNRAAHQLRVGTSDALVHRYLVTMVVPTDAGAGWSGQCGITPNLYFGAQEIFDAGMAFYTVDAGCTVTLSKVALDVGQEYQGTFSGNPHLDPRSAINDGGSQLNITNGSFRIVRTF